MLTQTNPKVKKFRIRLLQLEEKLVALFLENVGTGKTHGHLSVRHQLPLMVAPLGDTRESLKNKEIVVRSSLFKAKGGWPRFLKEALLSRRPDSNPSSRKL